MSHVHIHVQRGAGRVRVTQDGQTITVPIRAPLRRSIDSYSASEYEDLADRMAAALEELMGWRGTADDWEEHKHPRKSNGQFGSGGGSAPPAGATGPKPTSTRSRATRFT